MAMTSCSRCTWWHNPHNKQRASKIIEKVGTSNDQRSLTETNSFNSQPEGYASSKQVYSNTLFDTSLEQFLGEMSIDDIKQITSDLLGGANALRKDSFDSTDNQVENTAPTQEQEKEQEVQISNSFDLTLENVSTGNNEQILESDEKAMSPKKSDLTNANAPLPPPYLSHNNKSKVQFSIIPQAKQTQQKEKRLRSKSEAPSKEKITMLDKMADEARESQNLSLYLQAMESYDEAGFLGNNRDDDTYFELKAMSEVFQKLKQGDEEYNRKHNYNTQSTFDQNTTTSANEEVAMFNAFQRLQAVYDQEPRGSDSSSESENDDTSNWRREAIEKDKEKQKQIELRRSNTSHTYQKTHFNNTRLINNIDKDLDTSSDENDSDKF